MAATDRIMASSSIAPGLGRGDKASRSTLDRARDFRIGHGGNRTENLTGQAMQSRALTSTIRIKTLLLGSLGFQAMIEVGGTIPRQHLVRVRPPSAFALPDLLGPSLIRSF